MRGKSFNQPLHETNAVSKLPIEQANAVKALIISAWKRKSNIMRQLCPERDYFDPAISV
jgi:hypothetical protein